MNIGEPVKEKEYWPLVIPVPQRKVALPLVPVPIVSPTKEPVKV